MLRPIYVIAVNTHRELVRSKVLYAVLFVAAAMVLLSTFFGSVTIGDQVKVIKDFGLFAISLFSVVFAVISGSTLLFKELSRKTVYNIISKPVQRWQFVVGKALGMFFTTASMVAVMVLGLAGFTYLFESRFDALLLLAGVCILFEVAIVVAAAMFFAALVVTPALGGLFTFALFLAGRSSEYLIELKKLVAGSFAHYLFDALYYVLPHLEALYIGNVVVYGQSVSAPFIGWALLYTLGYSAALLVLASILFQRRDFN